MKHTKEDEYKTISHFEEGEMLKDNSDRDWVVLKENLALFLGFSQILTYGCVYEVGGLSMFKQGKSAELVKEIEWI